ALCPASRNPHLFDRAKPGTLYQREAILQSESDSFKHRACQVSSLVSQSQAHPRASCKRVWIRRPLAAKVWKKDQTLTAGRRDRGFGHQLVEARISRERVPVPLQASSGAQHHSHEMPAVWQRVTERM